MSDVVLIAAIGKNRELGKDNKLIWYLPEDLKFFKSETMGHAIVMGMNTFLSLPKVLPGRKNIVLTHRDVTLPEEVDVYHSLDELKEHLEDYGEEVFVIGGASLYGQMIGDATRMVLTEVDAEEVKADAYFPEFQKEEWEREVLSEHEQNKIKYKHVEYKRKLKNTI